MDLMTTNHLPASILPMRNLQTMPGLGFGLGVSVLLNVADFEALGSVGSFSWSGLAGTTFWVDPQEDLIAILMTQYITLEPKSLHADFRNLVYQALID
jgi:CubicO group peptidase (beta-lactamase class C family)